eukprot:4567228-Amphidinium_carterae.2
MSYNSKGSTANRSWNVGMAFVSRCKWMLCNEVTSGSLVGAVSPAAAASDARRTGRWCLVN